MVTRDYLIGELDRLMADAQNLRSLVATALAEEQIYETPTIGGITPLALVEKRAILAAVNAMQGNVIEAAKRLGIGKTTLYRKLREYAIPQPAPEES